MTKETEIPLHNGCHKQMTGKENNNRSLGSSGMLRSIHWYMVTDVSGLTTNQSSVTSQNSEGLTHTVAQAWNPAK